MVAISKRFHRSDGFSRREVDKARQALEIYLAEFSDEGGLRDDFDMTPDDYDAAKVAFMHDRHRVPHAQLKKRILRIWKMILILEGFRGRPIVQLHPSPWSEDTPVEITRSVDDGTIIFYIKFARALRKYADILWARGVYGVATNDAAREVAATINPKEWDGQPLGRTGEPIAIQLTQEEREAANEVRPYLEAVVSETMDGSAPR